VVATPGGSAAAAGGRLGLLAVALGLAAFGSLLIGRYPVAPADLLAALAARVLPITPDGPPEIETILMQIRLPRVGAAMLVGAALSVSGAAFQGIFRNPLVSPDILGVAAGAGFGAALALLLGLGTVGTQASAFAGGLAAVGVTYLIAAWRRGRGESVLVLVLGGIIVGTVFHALISLVKLAADPTNTLPAITFWLMGSLASVGGRDLAGAAPPILAGLAGLLAVRWRLNVMAFGDEEARTLGVDVGRTRLFVVACATLMTAAAVAISGVIGLVGLVVPHLARLAVGANFRVLLPTCAVGGALFLLLVDDLARTLVGGEIPLGILTALIGAPVFFLLLVDTRRGWA